MPSIRTAMPCCSSAAIKPGNARWYEIFVPIADRLYEEHLKELEEN